MSECHLFFLLLPEWNEKTLPHLIIATIILQQELNTCRHNRLLKNGNLQTETHSKLKPDCKNTLRARFDGTVDSNKLNFVIGTGKTEEDGRQEGHPAHNDWDLKSSAKGTTSNNS